MTYVLSVLATNIGVLALEILVSLITVPAENVIIVSVNRNGLAMFLIANLLTGLVNLNMQTIFASNSLAFTILLVYMFMVTLIAVLLHKNQINLKFW